MTLKVMFAVGLLCVAATVTEAAQGPRLTTPDYRGPAVFGPQTILGQSDLQPIPELAPMPMPRGCDLYDCVRYKNLGKIAPCAEPMIISIKDPCAPKKPNCCEPIRCVNVKICVPPCDCPKVKITRHGSKIRYDFGKYAVDVISRNGEILVDYDA